ncbi:MAG: DUF4912 domain-containing protein [Candidatus Omnitrophica bacterium]|nr:DUF4912 domain-containing protein [Candidatus Omnitrophota bacterium]MBU1869862.1 DUF4912 domain-containing protein [Candidatus Omnitrophota bacterium]
MAPLRKLKDRIKKIADKKITIKRSAIRKKPAKTAKKVVKQAPAEQIAVKKEILGTNELMVGQSKFSHPEVSRPRKVMPHELPHGYDQDKMVLLVRDPRWLYTYWELKSSTIERLKNELKELFYRAKRLLRVYDVSNVIFNGTNAHSHFDINVNEYANNWYINTDGPGKAWCVDFGLLLPDGKFITLLRSNTVQTPLDGPSWITDEEWMIPDEIFARLYGMGFGLGQSSPVGKAWQERIKKVLFSGVLASPGMASMASPVKKQKKERKFWFILDCELIVYGATEPDAKVTVQGREIKLRPDGTFTMRYALPDGKQVIPVKAVSSDNIEERTITPTVTRETKSSILVKEEIHK